MIFIPYELRPENIQILDYQHSVSESLCEPIHHSKALDKLFLVIKSALLDSLIQSKYGQKTVGAFSASNIVHACTFGAAMKYCLLFINRKFRPDPYEP